MRAEEMVRGDKVRVKVGYESLQTHSLHDDDEGHIESVARYGAHVVTDDNRTGFVPAIFLEKVEEEIGKRG